MKISHYFTQKFKVTLGGGGGGLLNSKCSTQLLNRIDLYYSTFQTTRAIFYPNSYNVPQTFTGFSPNPKSTSRSEVVNTIGGPVFWYGDRGGLNKKEIALTFDDGPHAKLTQELLKTLKLHDVKATFFVLGKNAKRYPKIIHDINNAGHTIANHSHNHNNLPKYSNKHGENEIVSGFNAVVEVLGGIAPFFRFPYGAKTKHLSNFLKQNDYATFFWDVDTLDWKIKNPEELLNFALSETYKMKNGIVLFHDIQPQTIAMMPFYIETLRSEGYQFVVYEPKEWIADKQ